MFLFLAGLLHLFSLSDAGDLVVRSVNYQVESNSRRHRTDKYFLSKRPIHPQLIVRRGQPFELRITFERKFRYSEDVLSLVFLVKGMAELVNFLTLFLTLCSR